MAWKDGFVIEYAAGEQPPEGKLTCRKCIHFDTDDKSCEVTGQCIPGVGYDSWRHCRYLKLSKKYDTAANRALIESHCRCTGLRIEEWDPDRIIGIKKGARVWHNRRGLGIVDSCANSVVCVRFKATGKTQRFSIPRDLDSGLIDIIRPGDVIRACRKKHKSKIALEEGIRSRIKGRVEVGSRVSSRKRGSGVVIAMGKEQIVVRFDKERKGVDTVTYDFPGAFVRCAIRLLDKI